MRVRPLTPMFPTTPIILILGLTVATCVIAYWADNLGKKLGKKRLSLFGLRPRQTATVISMATSVGIMLFTLLVLLWSNASLRNALLNYDYVRNRANRLREQADRYRAQADAASQQLKSAQTQLKTTEVRLERESQSVRDAQSRTQSARQLLARTRGNLQSARTAESAARRGQLAAQRGQRAAELARKQARQGELRAESAQLAAFQRASRLERQLITTRRELESNSQNLEARRKQLKNVQNRLNNIEHRLVLSNNSVRDANEANEKLSDRANALNDEINELSARRTLLEAAVRQTAQEYDVATEILVRLGVGNIAVGVDHVFAERTFQPSGDPAQLRAQVRQLLAEAAESALKLGGRPFAYPEEGGTVSALHLVPVMRDAARPGAVVSEEQQIANWANYLSTFKVPVSLRVLPARSFAEGETRFFARLRPVPVGRVFVAGETITSSVIDGNATDAQIFNSLVALVNAGEKLARSRRMDPVLTEEAPDFYAADTNERIFDALREVQMQARQVRVRLVAAEEATTVDRLRIRFVVERLAS